MRYAFVLVLPALCSVVFCGGFSAQGDHLYSISSTDGLLRRVDPVTGANVWTVQMVTNNNVNAQGCVGLTYHPASGMLYAIMREVSQPSVRKLAVVNPLTGAATIVGVFNDNFAALAFRSDGVLFAVTGDGANVPESLYTLNPANAAPTFVMTLGSGGPGESISFGADGYLYHFSGCCVHNVDTILERIDTVTNAVTPIPLSGFSYFEILSSTLLAGGNMLCADLYDQVLIINTSGVSAQIAQFGHSAVKGLAFVPSPSTQPFLRIYGNGCPASSGYIPTLLGNGTPTPGSLVQLDLVLAPPSASGLFAIGTGNGILPIPSAACQVQIMPVMPTILTFTTSVTGTWNVSSILQAGLAGDFFAQVAVYDGPNLVVSNPIQAHVQ